MSDRQEVLDRLVSAAESVLRAHGAAGFTVRAVTAAAGVNVATVSTVAGGRRALLQAVLRRRLGELAGPRLRVLAQAREAGGGVQATWEAFVDPLVHLEDAEGRLLADLLRLLEGSGGQVGGAAHCDEGGVSGEVGHPVGAVEWLLDDPVVAALERDLSRLLPHLPPAVLSQRLVMAVVWVHAVLTCESPRVKGARSQLLPMIINVFA